jgi:hypothetical protein
MEDGTLFRLFSKLRVVNLSSLFLMDESVRDMYCSECKLSSALQALGFLGGSIQRLNCSWVRDL